MIRCLVLFLCLGIGLPNIIKAEDWSVSPELERAVALWLGADDPTVGLTEIGERALAGELAAARLANVIAFSVVPLEIPDIDRDSRLALFPDPATGRFQRLPYPIEAEDSAVKTARLNIHQSETAAEWLSQAQTLREAGHLMTIRRAVRIQESQRPEYVETSILFAEETFPPDDPIWLTIWSTRAMLQAVVEVFGEDSTTGMSSRARFWDGPIWGPDQIAAFNLALDQERWTAIRTLAFILAFNAEGVLATVDAPPDVFKIAEIYGETLGRDRMPVRDVPQDDLEKVGEIVTDNQWFAPLQAACAQACPDTTLSCLGAGALIQVERNIALNGEDFGPALSEADYLVSARAHRHFLVSVGWGLRGEYLRVQELPHCLLDAARTAAAPF